MVLVSSFLVLTTIYMVLFLMMGCCFGWTEQELNLRREPSLKEESNLYGQLPHSATELSVQETSVYTALPNPATLECAPLQGHTLNEL